MARCGRQIKTADGVERCEATIEIRKNGQVATFYGGKVSCDWPMTGVAIVSACSDPSGTGRVLVLLQELLSEYVFKERAWPRACVIEVRAGGTTSSWLLPDSVSVGEPD